MVKVGFTTGNPRVGISHTAPEPVYTVPVAGTGTHRPVNRRCLYKTRGNPNTRGFVVSLALYNLAKAARTSIDVAGVSRGMEWDGETKAGEGTYLAARPLVCMPAVPSLLLGLLFASTAIPHALPGLCH